MKEMGNSRWTHPSVILVATDLTELERLMPFAMQQAEETGARLILLHVLATNAGLATDASGLPYYDPSGALEFAEKIMQPWCDQARGLGIVCDGLVREGNVTQQIAASIRQFQADRILLGTRSRSRLGKLLLGSVAEQVLRSVNLPVITVGPEAHLLVDTGNRERVVLHATTLRETSRPSAALACQIASQQKARLIVLHVLPPVDEMERQGLATGLHSTAMQQLRALTAETGAGCGSTVEPRVVHGNPSIEILATASDLGASLIILGTTHRSALENLTRDNTVYRVLAHARCPVLTLREPVEHAAESKGEHAAILLS